MKKPIVYITLLVGLLISCSEDKSVYTDSKAAVIKPIANRVEGEVPRDMSIFTVISGKQVHSVSDLYNLYLSDTHESKGQNYDANLKNMWLVVINPRLIAEGSDQQKEFFIREQLALENNLAHFNGFYKLLLETNSIPKEEKIRLAKEFYDKNKNAIAEIVWQNPEEKKDKETELLLARRSFATKIDLAK